MTLTIILFGCYQLKGVFFISGDLQLGRDLVAMKIMTYRFLNIVEYEHRYFLSGDSFLIALQYWKYIENIYKPNQKLPAVWMVGEYGGWISYLTTKHRERNIVCFSLKLIIFLRPLTRPPCTILLSYWPCSSFRGLPRESTSPSAAVHIWTSLI